MSAFGGKADIALNDAMILPLRCESRLDGIFGNDNVYLLPQRPNLCLERCPRPEQIGHRPTNEPAKIPHPTTGLPEFSINCQPDEVCDRDRNRSTTIPKIILQRSNIPQRIIQFCVCRQLHGIYDRDRMKFSVHTGAKAGAV